MLADCWKGLDLFGHERQGPVPAPSALVVELADAPTDEGRYANTGVSPAEVALPLRIVEQELESRTYPGYQQQIIQTHVWLIAATNRDLVSRSPDREHSSV